MELGRALIAVMIGMAGGVVSGLFGVGGAIVVVPALTWLMRMTQHEAQGTSLGALLLPVGLLGFLEYYRHGRAHLPVSVLLAVGLFLGAFFGGWLAQKIPTHHMKIAFGSFLIVIGIRLMIW
ncbi:MAG: sulfite exporter TauE/SafE family protein [Armatimonadetes bacterium]|nr:sulfite exporter TauE/SafE family protein [Armatimonadota bacterium]MDW8122535.1 sulfite exporter TauE/SafE family protein [Armatimonadota bacterium]